MGAGTFTASAVTDLGGNQYQVTVPDTTGMSVGDHVGMRLTSATGAHAVYVIASVDSGTQFTVNDTLTEQHGGVFGVPFATSEGWYATPSDGFSLPPDKAKPWGAAVRRNAHLLGSLSKQDAGSVAITGGSIAGITDLAVADGGTGASTAAGARTNLGAQEQNALLDDIAGLGLSAGDLLYYNGANLTRLGLGSTGQVLKVLSGPTLGWGADATSGGSSNHNLLDGSVHPDTVAGTVARGDLITGQGGTPAWTRLARGTVNQVLSGDGTDVQWRDISAVLDQISNTRGSVLYRGASAWVALSPGSAGQVLQSGGAGADPSWTSVSSGVVLPRVAGGRLSPTTDAYGTSSGSTTLYYVEAVGNRAALYDGSSAWAYHDIAGSVSLAVSAFPSSGAANTNYDVFLYDNAGTLTLEAVAWTNDTTRATALVWQDGVRVKSGATARRYVGTVRLNASTQLQQDAQRSFIWNENNRRKVTLGAKTTSSHTVASTSFARLDSSAAWSLREFVCGDTAAIKGVMTPGVGTCASNNVAWCGIGVDSTSAIHAGCYGGGQYIAGSATAESGNTPSLLRADLAAGYHAVYAIGRGDGVATITFGGYQPTLQQIGMAVGLEQ